MVGGRECGPYGRVRGDDEDQVVKIYYPEELEREDRTLEDAVWEFANEIGRDVVNLERVPGTDMIRLTAGQPTVWFRLEEAFLKRDSEPMLGVVDRFLEDRQNLMDVLAAIPTHQWECVASGPSLILFATIFVLERYGIIDEGPDGLDQLHEMN